MRIFRDLKELLANQKVKSDIKKEIADLSALILEKIKQGKFRGNGWKK